MITFDCTEPDALARWWAGAVDGEVAPVAAGEFTVVICPAGPRLAFQRVDDPTPGKNRVHVDFTATDVDAEVTRLTALRAVETGRHSFGEHFWWVVMRDPAGNVFSVAAAH